MKDYEKINLLVEGLLEAYDKEDPDYKAAKPFLDGIKEIFTDFYSYSDFCVWLAKHKGEILLDFRYADIVSKEDYINPGDWEQAKVDAILVSDDKTSAVLSAW